MHYSSTVDVRSWVVGAVLTLLLGAGACGSQDVDSAAAEPAAGSASQVDQGQEIIVRDVGLQTPESAQHDAAADVYIVSNISGGPSHKANNGFLSRISPDGSVADLRWIEGGRDGVVLHAPKGMAISGDSLFVADIDTVRIFHRQTGAPLGAWAVPGSTFLNDLAAGTDGSLYVSDTGIRFGADGAEETGSDAIYRFSASGQPEPIARGPELMRPNGLLAQADGVLMVPFGSNEVVHVTFDGQLHPMARLPAGQLDGIVRSGDGSLLVSSWEGQAVYRIAPSGVVSTVVEGRDAPADLGYDALRNRVLIPRFMLHGLDIVTLP